MHRRLAPLLAFAPLALAAAPASAHITMLDPPPRTDSQKSGPCGAGPGDMRGDIITNYKGGETITIKWIETVNHPGHYRISFDADGQDDFADPPAYDAYYSNDAVLLDQIEDKSGQNTMYEAQITLPEMSCDNCTIQLTQMMTDKPPYGDGNDLYYQCADIVIEGVVAGTSGDDTTGSTSDATTGDATTTTTTGDATTTSSTGSPHESHGETGSDPTTGGAGTEGGTSSPGSGSSGTSAGTGEPMTDEGDACSCRSDTSPGWALLALMPLLAHRRRRA
jgi:MYXO-CTERM domain-containing protein